VTRVQRPEGEFVQSPRPGDVLAVAPGDTTLSVRFFAWDPDPVARGFNTVEFRYKFDLHPLPGGGSRQETFYPLFDWQPSPDGRWFGEVELQNGQAFIPGEYIISVQVQETLDPTITFVGKRIKTRSVRFTIVER
jgi:hypothetical protein